MKDAILTRYRLGTLRDSMLGKVARMNEADSGLDFVMVDFLE